MEKGAVAMQTVHKCIQQNYIDALEKEISELKIEIAVAKSNIAEVKGDIQMMKNDIKELRIEVKQGFIDIRQTNSKWMWSIVGLAFTVLSSLIVNLIK
jgi:predicted  nucleic acid-binding Zn-ribbon protein